MFKASIPLGKIAGIEIGIHYSWFAVLALVSWSLAEGYLPSHFPGWSARTYWATGLVAGLLLFASVLVHELAHSVVAKARGFPVEGITLFLLGGVSRLRAESRRARDEFVISVVGPITSIVLSAVFGIAMLAFQEGNIPAQVSVWYLTLIHLKNTPVAAVVWYLAFINLLLAIFNLLPAFPLDGGRVLRSVIWGTTGSLSRATTVAAWGGRIIGLLLIALGVVQILGGNFLGGLWIAFVGWFLHRAAGESQREAVAEDAIQGVRVRDVMDAYPVTIGPGVSLSEAVHEYFVRRGARALPVCEGDQLVGIITLTDIKGVPQERWSFVTVGDEMTSIPLKHVNPEDELHQALALLGEHSINQTPVLEGERLVGLLSRAHIIRYLHSRRELGIRRGW